MPSELDTHDILFNPLNKRRAEQTTRRTADRPSSPDRDAPTTDRPVAYAISDIADAEVGPLIYPKWIAGIAAVAAIFTAAVLLRTPALGTSAESGTVAAGVNQWWTVARQQWADESMRVWPLVVRAGHSKATAAEVRKNALTIPPPAAEAPAQIDLAARSRNPYSTEPRTKTAAPTKAPSNPYGDSPARQKTPAATRTDNPY